MGPKPRDSSVEAKPLFHTHPPPPTRQFYRAFSYERAKAHHPSARLQITGKALSVCPVAVAFGRIVRRLRRDQKLSLVELARRSYVDLARLMLMDRGELSPTILELVRLATTLDVRASALLRCLDETTPTDT